MDFRKKKTKCRRGHRLVGKNLYLRSDGFRECRQCSLIRARRYNRIKKKGQQAA